MAIQRFQRRNGSVFFHAQSDSSARSCKCARMTGSSVDGKGVEAGVEPYEVVVQGQLLDHRYELLSPIGKGNFGVVWRAIDRRFGLPVAVKLAQDSTSAQLFEQEIGLLTELQHPGVVVLRDRWLPSEARTRPYFVMEYCDSTLKALLVDHGRLSLERACTVFLDLCRTVEFIHSKNKIHRDLKPSNVLICSVGGQLIPRIADFGIAREIPARSNTATQGVGTETYKSPELGLGRRLEGSSDVFTLAVILIEALTGHVTPDDNVAWWQYVHSYDAAIVKERLQNMLGTSLSPAALGLITRALSTVAADRPGALDFGEMFVRATRDVPVHQQRSRERFFLVVAATNTFGYLLGALPPVFVDPTLYGRYGYGARNYPDAWMIGPLSLFVYIATAVLCSYFPRKLPWLALVPPFLAGVATVPILAPGGEIPHASLTSCCLIWIAITGMWVGLRQLLNTPDGQFHQPFWQERGRLFEVFRACVAIIAILALPILYFSNKVASTLSKDLLETARLQSVAWFDCAMWIMFWLAGPTREAAIAWRREASIAHH